ncbi:MAG: hypothetical protein LW878_12300 [Proteobacteria bacterium]|nr:hypothetical protein [Pseudomonadota bacterium]
MKKGGAWRIYAPSTTCNWSMSGASDAWRLGTASTWAGLVGCTRMDYKEAARTHKLFISTM